MRCDLAESSDANPFTRLQRELAELTGPQRAELEWRSMMRRMEVAQASVAAPGLVDILRRLLLARLFMDGQIDASTVRAAAAQPVRNIQISLASGGQTGVSGDATQFLTYLISEDAHFGSATQEAAAQRGMGIHVRDGDPVLDDIRQIKSGFREPWQNLPPLTFENMPQYIVAGEGNQPLYTRGSVHPFWADWYRQVIDGRPPNDPLLRDVALIDDAIWQAGGDALDGAIDLIVERHRLLAEVRNLRALLRDAGQPRPNGIGPGHNHPPEPVDVPAELLAASADIDQALATAEDILSRRNPSASALTKVGSFLRDAALAVGRYCAATGDKAVNEAAKSFGTTIGKLGATAVVGWCLAHADTIQKLAQDLIAFAHRLP